MQLLPLLRQHTRHDCAAKLSLTPGQRRLCANCAVLTTKQHVLLQVLSKFMPTSRRLVQFSDGKTAPANAKIVYIDGAFDLFHVGHIKVLQVRPACIIWKPPLHNQKTHDLLCVWRSYVMKVASLVHLLAVFSLFLLSWPSGPAGQLLRFKWDSMVSGLS